MGPASCSFVRGLTVAEGVRAFAWLNLCIRASLIFAPSGVRIGNSRNHAWLCYCVVLIIWYMWDCF